MATTLVNLIGQDDIAAWRGFAPGSWRSRVNVREFIQRNYTPYEGDSSFLQGATDRTRGIWKTLQPLLAQEREKGILDVSQVPSGILAHAPGYIDKANELIVGLQTEAPLKRAIMPFGGWRVVANSLESYGYKPDPLLGEIFTKYRKTHNDGVFDAYTPDIRKARSSHIVTGLPDAYGRGRIIGDYRRVALYGVDFLVADKERERHELDHRHSTEDVIRLREELAEQIRSLRELKEMAKNYGHDISGPATTAREAVQWTYFGYLAAIKQQNGAAMSAGRLSTFWDIYIERDLRAGQADRAAGAGAHRRRGDQMADRPLPAGARVQPALLRRPGVGHRDAGRHGRGWPHPGHQVGLPDAAHALQSRAGARAQPHRVLVAAPARWLQALRHQDVDRHQCDPVRIGRPDAAEVRRRLRHRLLRLGDAGRQADAVLRRAREPAQDPAVCPQWRTRRGERRPGRAEARARDRRHPELRRGHGPARSDDGLAGQDLRQRAELHPLHARQVLLRGDRDGAARSRRAAHPGLRHRRAVARHRQPVGHQARQGQAGARHARADRRLPDRRRVSRASATTTIRPTTSPRSWCRR